METNLIQQNLKLATNDRLTQFRRLLEIKKQLDSVKPLYEEIDKINMELSLSTCDGYTMFDTENDLVHKFVDNFATKNTAFKVASVRRFDTITESIEKFEKRQERAAKKAAKEAKAEL